MDIINKKILAEKDSVRITSMELFSPDIARKVRPGQFVIIMVDEKGERIPLTVVNKNVSNGTITIVFQEVGFTTKMLGKLNVGDKLYTLVGPLGHPTEIKNYNSPVILVGGGVGVAEILPVAQELKNSGNYIITILGARTKELVILENEISTVSDKVYITTDDGSYGEKGFVTDILKKLLIEIVQTPTGYPIGLIYTVGPIPMMMKVAELTKPLKIKTVVSLNPIMIDGTGMCGSCRVTIRDETKLACVDGPEFDAHEVCWQELIARNRIYLDKEQFILKT